jgi:hypothetical protein
LLEGLFRVGGVDEFDYDRVQFVFSLVIEEKVVVEKQIFLHY